MLDKHTTDQLLDAIRRRPCTVQELAQLTGRNWRTAERYVEAIARENGLISTRTFREGTRGALKVVYWNALDVAKGSAYQERLLARIEHGVRKEDFSPFDIYQFVREDAREAIIETQEFSRKDALRFDAMLTGAHEQILSFSGNLSWIDLGPDMPRTLERLAKRKVSVKILTRVDTVSERTVRKLLALNHRVGWDAIEIRHCEQPLRTVIVDDKLASMKEVLSPALHRELKKKRYIFYLVRDQEWITWLQRVFWHLWGKSVDAQLRLDALKTIEN